MNFEIKVTVNGEGFHQIDENLRISNGSYLSQRIMYWRLIYSVMVFSLMDVVFSMRVNFFVYRFHQWGKNIERLSSDENVFRLIFSFVCLATTDGTCSGF